jgi:signal transduction histidine kinase
VTLLYFAAGKLGLSLAFEHGSASPVWPPTGVALAALLLFGLRLWPAVLLGAFAVNLSTTGHVPSSLGIAGGNTAEAVVGVLLVERWAGGRSAFHHGRGFFAFVVVACLGATAVSATVGFGSLLASRLAPWNPDIWLTWWTGDAVGGLVVAPVLVTWLDHAYAPAPSPPLARVGFAYLLLLAVAATVFTLPPAGGAPLAFLCLPALILLAYLFGPRHAATGAFLLSVAAVASTVAGRGPFVLPDANQALLVLQAFMGICALVALALAAVESERRVADEALRASHAELERRVAARTADLANANTLLRDEIAERVAAQADLARHAAELARSNADLERFAYVASHDLQEPLRMVSSFVQLLHKRYSGRLDADADRFIGFAVDGASRMRALISGLLDYARAGTTNRTVAPVNTRELVATVLQDHAEALREAGAEVSCRDLPVVAGDRLQLQQVFANLLTNALKFRRGPPRIEVVAEPTAGGWRFTVRDDGIGIDEQHISRLFAAFVRLHGPAEYAGAGIGLAVCKRIIDRHGGRIWVESRRGVGSSFHFVLPEAAPPDASLV